MKKKLCLFLISIALIHLSCRIILSFSPFSFYDLFFPLIGTSFNDKKFTHEKFMEVKIGTPKADIDNMLGNETLQRHGYYPVDTAFFHTKHSRENNKSTIWRDYGLFYDENKILIAKHYRPYYE